MMREGKLSMAEANRAVVIGQVAEKRLRQREAADRLGLSVRQVKRLLARYRERGPAIGKSSASLKPGVKKTTTKVTLSKDIRNSIHRLEGWPFQPV